ncbi:tetratricopeptide repeat protein [Chroococcus sp. FPU101]|uniref:tetratricopeptide repeat protein n=1 Tax=Chroococcus sp. FPU101 TaxID=1974212 RepID=UPI001A8C1C6E|nr:tetratricopeptide repeat protein [Chroococcus sp. FPU101]GFE70660.1 hypothetical protein CFPU101_32700 [Chroococcus sp. FPU101]
MNYLKRQTQAYKSINLGQYDEAIKDYEICINTNPDDLTNFWYLGLIYLLQENILEAQAIWMSVLFPEISERKKNQTLDLIEVLKKELIKQLKVGNLEIAKRLEIQIKELDEHYLIENLEQAAQVTINKLFKQASQLRKKGNDQEAETKYQQILLWNHQNAEVWQELGLLYFQRFEYRKALDCAMNAIYLNPKSGKYHYHVGLILEKLKQIPQSIQAYYKALELDPTLVAAYHEVSNLISLIGELEKIKKIDR